MDFLQFSLSMGNTCASNIRVTSLLMVLCCIFVLNVSVYLSIVFNAMKRQRRSDDTR